MFNPEDLKFPPVKQVREPAQLDLEKYDIISNEDASTGDMVTFGEDGVIQYFYRPKAHMFESSETPIEEEGE